MRAVGATIVPGVIAAATAGRWLDAIEPVYAAARRGPSPAGFDRYSSSLRLGSLPSINVDAVLAEVFRGRIADVCRSSLGTSIACPIDHCWVRRQYPLLHYPPSHAAHRWHQDGALAFDFLRGDPAAALLPMATCWIALTACGDDAPGLEFCGDDGGMLLSVAALADDAIARLQGSGDRHRPVFAAGDAVVFGPGLVHRTHVHAAMTRERTSIELRFLATERLPARIRGTRLVAVH